MENNILKEEISIDMMNNNNNDNKIFNISDYDTLTERFKMFVFDWSGTLSNDMHPVFLSNNAMLSNRNKLPLTWEEWKCARCGNVVEFAYKYGILDTKTERDAKKEAEVYKEFEAYYGQFYTQEKTAPKPYDNSRELLLKLKKKGCIMAIVSSHPQNKLMAEIKTYGFDPSWFTTIIGSSLDKKGDLLLLSNMNGVENAFCIYMGDCCQDVLVSKNAGYGYTISITHGYHSKKDLQEMNPDLIIDDLATLIELI
jgi:phosphoglycolate phosphatase-like HAD superfamily hydrolase